MQCRRYCPYFNLSGAMGASASQWSSSPMIRLIGTKKCLTPDVTGTHKPCTAVTPKVENRITVSLDLCVGQTVRFLDSSSFRSLTYVSKNLLERFHSRGDEISIAANFKLFGTGYGRKLCFHIDSSKNISTCKNLITPPEWRDVCNLLLGFLHAKVPGGSQTSTSMALALASSFISEVRRRKSLSSITDKKVDQLCSNPYLLAFTALAIAIKVEEGLYFKCDSIPFPTEEFKEGSRSTLSTHSVLAAEQIILRVLKMAVPICHFAQFARPLWHKIMTLDDEQWRLQMRSDYKKIVPIIPLQAKQTIFRFIHHASARLTDCSEEGCAIHPSAKALCVSIISIAINSLINTKQRRADLQARCHAEQVRNTKKFGEVTRSNCPELRPEGKKKRVVLKHPRMRASIPNYPVSHSMNVDKKIRFPTSTPTAPSFVQLSSDTFTDSPIAAVLPDFNQKSHDSKTATFGDVNSFYEFSKANAVVNVTPAAAIHNSANTSTVKRFERTVGISLGTAISKGTENRNQEIQQAAPVVRVPLDTLNTNIGAKKRKLPGDISDNQLKTADKMRNSSTIEEDRRSESSIYASPFSAVENLGSELIASLLHGDLTKTEVMTQRKNRRKEYKYSDDGEQSAQNLHTPRNALKIFQMILDALIANQGELKRLKHHILCFSTSPLSSKECNASADVISPFNHLYRASTDVAISSPSESSSSSLMNQNSNNRLKQHTQKYLPETKILVSVADKVMNPRRNQHHPVVFPVTASKSLFPSNHTNDNSSRKTANVKTIPEVDSISVETFRMMFNIDFKSSSVSSKRKTKEGCDLIETICNITQRELSLMQSQISTAIHGIFSRHKKIPVLRFITPAVCSLRNTRIAINNTEVNEFDRKKRCNLKNNSSKNDVINDSDKYMNDSYHSNFCDLKQRKELKDKNMTETIQNRKSEIGQRYENMDDEVKSIDKENRNNTDYRDCFHPRSSDRIRGRMMVGRKLEL